jgi:hypothetical protein
MSIRRSAITLAALLMSGAAQAQTAGLERAVGALSSPPAAEELVNLAASNEPAYVFFMQTFLRNRGTFGGTVNGEFNSTTVRAVLDYCGEVGLAELCSAGPLVPATVAAVAAAVAIELTPPVPQARLPEGWAIAESGVGLITDVVVAGPSEATIHVTGTATAAGVISIGLAPLQAAQEGVWILTISASQEAAADSAMAAIELKTAMLYDDGSAATDLFVPVAVPAGAQPQPLIAGGLSNAKHLLPYVQVAVQAGDTIDTTIRLAYPAFGRLPSL